MTQSPKLLELALQGGGAHGAFTWGVLDRLLELPDLHIEAISGTSAGAMNAVVLADGLELGGPSAARESLHNFWKAVSDAGKNSPIQRDFWAKLTGNWGLDNSPSFLFFDQLSRMLSPYELNPLNLNPLRDLLAKQVDFDRVHRCSKLSVFVTATNVRTGRPKIFHGNQLTADAVMASAALPFMYQAVEIDGDAYWDGGYVGNPALFPLVDGCDSRDMLLIQINPIERREIPRTAREIINRLNEITFNSSLIKELRSLSLFKEFVTRTGIEDERYRDMRLHCIHGDVDLLALQASSKLNAEWDYLIYLRDLGRKRTEEWLNEHWDDVGQRSSFKIDCPSSESFRPIGVNKESKL